MTDISTKDVFGDRRQLVHKSPCSQCPFRKSSIQGWLGGYEVETYYEPVIAGIPTSCHMHDYGMKNARTRLCAGSCATMANGGVEPLNGHEASIDEVGKREDCFDSPDDFGEYHAFGT